MIVRLDWSDYSPERVRELKCQGCQVMLDVNIYDIPNTMNNALENLRKVGVDCVTVIQDNKKVLINL